MTMKNAYFFHAIDAPLDNLVEDPTTWQSLKDINKYIIVSKYCLVVLDQI